MNYDCVFSGRSSELRLRVPDTYPGGCGKVLRERNGPTRLARMLLQNNLSRPPEEKGLHRRHLQTGNSHFQIISVKANLQ